MAGRADGTTSTIGFMSGTSQASGIHALYTPKGLLPTSALIDLGVPDALTTITSGPATYARASVADPGEVLANPDALLSQAGIPGYKAGTFPAYPYRATANSSVGNPQDESTPAPGLNARASATSTGSTAEATMPSSTAAAIATFGSQSAHVTTTTDGHTVTLRALSKVSAFDLANGLLHVDSLVIDLSATSDGHTTTTTGATTISGASVLGQPVTIDASGVHAQAGPSPSPSGGPLEPVNGVLSSALPAATDTLNVALKQAGITITAGGPVALGKGSVKQLAETGLRIDLDVSDKTVPGLDALLASVPYLPPLAPGVPGVSDLIQLARVHQLSTIEVGRAAVALSASPQLGGSLPGALPSASVPTTAPTTGTPSTGTDGAGVGVVPVLPVTPVGGSPDAAVAPPAVAPGTGLASRLLPSSPLGRGVGALGLMAVFAAFLIGDRLSVGARWLVATDASASCPLEER